MSTTRGNEKKFTPLVIKSHVGRNKSVRAIARTGVSGKHHPNSPETPLRATRPSALLRRALDGLIPAYTLSLNTYKLWIGSES